MNLSTQAILSGIPERRVTRWHNPLAHAQRIVLDDGAGQKFLFTVAPGDTKELDSRYDRAIHMVDCGHDGCHKRGWFCREGHDGLIVGGLAPLLRRAGHDDPLDPSLDPVAADRKALVAELDREADRARLLEEMRAERRGAEAPAEGKTAPADGTVFGKAAPSKK